MSLIILHWGTFRIYQVISNPTLIDIHYFKIKVCTPILSATSVSSIMNSSYTNYLQHCTEGLRTDFYLMHFPMHQIKRSTQLHCYQVNDCQKPNFISKR